MIVRTPEGSFARTMSMPRLETLVRVATSVRAGLGDAPSVQVWSSTTAGVGSPGTDAPCVWCVVMTGFASALLCTSMDAIDDDVRPARPRTQ